MMMIDRLIGKIKQTQNPSVIGLDPRLSYIPDFIKEQSYEKFGHTLEGASDAILTFNKMLLDEIADVIPAIKPQIAMYERFGTSGIDCYIKTIEYAKAKDLVVIGDIKRSDIASTAEAYSDAHIGVTEVEEAKFEVFKEDFITLNPYLGIDSIEPFLNDCRQYERGLFILAKTSNPNSGEIQDLQVDGMPIYEKVGQLIAKWGEELIGTYGFSEVGAVVGATHKAQAEKLRKLMPHTFFLVPGYGAQGGSADDLSVCFNKEGVGAIVNSSRGIIAAHQSKTYSDFKDEQFAKAARQACLDMKSDLGRCI